MAKTDKKTKLSRKERKKQERALRLKQDALEKQLVAEGKISARVKYVPRSFLGNIFAVMLAFLFGAFVAIGGVLGAGYYASSVLPVRDALGMFNVDSDKIVEEEYGKLSVLALVQDFLQTLEGISGGDFPLNAIGKYTPVVGNTLGTLCDALGDLGVHVEKETLMAKNVSELGGYFRDEVMTGVVLGEALKLTPESNAMMIAICYGSEGSSEDGGDYTVDENGKFVMNEGKSALTLGELTESNDAILNRVTIESALGVKPDGSTNPAIMFLAYGTEGTNYEIRDGKVEMLVNPYTGEKFRKKTLADLTSDQATSIEDARISDLINTSDATGILQAIKIWKISDLKDANRIRRLKIGQVIGSDEGDTSLLLKAISSWRIGDLTDQSMIDSLTLGDVLDTEGGPKLLRSLKDTKLGDMGDKINSLRFGEILEDSAFTDNALLANLKNSSLATIGEDIKTISVRDVYGEGVYAHFRTDTGATYADVIKNYDPEADPKAEDEPTKKKAETPAKYTVPKDATIAVKRVQKGGASELTLGWFSKHQPLESGEASYRLTDEVFTRTAEGIVSFYTHYRVKLVPVLKWMRFDYAQNKPVELQAGDHLSAELDESYKDETVKDGSPALQDGTGRDYYFYTVRTSGEEPEITETKVRYAVKEDDFGVYYVYMTPEGKSERVDLEYFPEAYTVQETEERVEYDAAENTVSYKGHTYPVQTQRAAADAEAYDYFELEEEAVERYYDASLGRSEFSEGEVFTEDRTEEKIAASWEGNADVPVERYLSGVWYLMFGVQEGETGSRTVQDFTDTPVLEIDGRMTNTTTKLNTMPLWEMYLHGVIDSDPYAKVNEAYRSILSEIGIDKTNINAFTIDELIKFTGKLASSPVLGA